MHIPRCLNSQGGFKELGLVRHRSLGLAGLIAAFCRNQPRFSLVTPRASSIRFAGLAPALDPAVHPLEIRKRLIRSIVPPIFATLICNVIVALHKSIRRRCEDRSSRHDEICA
ncbi:hypothetical protein PAMC26577_00055 [Caballeronia sordidicola]|uniref:Uncharacterized protein n=1 Tax=Caballeronia sordidicola TaxID=196367 RepID=A0A242N9F0_CABSO|nr:hypothetical protein PAMC26577_00055 [Caballeronia sordidicola]